MTQPLAVYWRVPRIPMYPEQVFETVFVPLTKGHIATVDATDLLIVSSYCWGSNGRYAIAHSRTMATTYMHRVILGLTPGDGRDVDHENGDGFDNRRSNLRIATHQQNMRNIRKQKLPISGFKGVYPNHDRWAAAAHLSYRKVYIGTFDTREEAAAAYDEFAKRHFGEFAHLNGIA